MHFLSHLILASLFQTGPDTNSPEQAQDPLTQSTVNLQLNDDFLPASFLKIDYAWMSDALTRRRIECYAKNGQYNLPFQSKFFGSGNAALVSQRRIQDRFSRFYFLTKASSLLRLSLSLVFLSTQMHAIFNGRVSDLRQWCGSPAGPEGDSVQAQLFGYERMPAGPWLPWTREGWGKSIAR